LARAAYLPRDNLERWILTYLGTIDLDKSGSGRATLDIRTIVKLIPKEIFPEIETEEDIMETLRDMERRNLVKEWASARYIDEYTFIITGTGLIQFRKQIHPIIASVAKQETYEKMIEAVPSTPGDSSFRRELKSMWSKLKDKTEEEIVQTLVKKGVETGTKIATMFIVNYFAHGAAVGNGPN
jgi:hypothetical protein